MNRILLGTLRPRLPRKLGTLACVLTLIALLFCPVKAASVAEDPTTMSQSALESSVLNSLLTKRFYCKVHGLLPPLPGFYVDLGVEYNPRGGVWAGIEASPLGFSYSAYHLSTQFHVLLGYSGTWFALGATVGTGFAFVLPDDLVGLFQVGPALRIGRMDRTHVRMRVSFSAFPAYLVPINGEIELDTPLTARIWLAVNLGGDAGLSEFHGRGDVNFLLPNYRQKILHMLSVGLGFTLAGPLYYNATSSVDNLRVELPPIGAPALHLGYEVRW